MKRIPTASDCAGTAAHRSSPRRHRRRSARRVTVVFSDLKGSTSLGERLDSEALREVLELLRGDERRPRPTRRDGREVHRRRDHGRLRTATAARGRRPARGPGGRGDARGPRGDQRTAREGLRRPSGEPDRGQYRRGRLGRHHHRPAARDRRHRQRCRPAGAVGAILRGADRATDLRAGARRRQGRAGGAAGAQGQGGTRSRLPAPACRGGRGARAVASISRWSAGPSSSWNCRRCSTWSGRPEGRSSRPSSRRRGRGSPGSSTGSSMDAGAKLTSLSGRCLPYGEGITYWPIAEAIRGLAQVMQDDPADVASERVLALFADIPDAGKRVASAIGLTERCLPGGRDRLGGPSTHRGARRQGPGDHGARRHPLGGAHTARPRAGPGGVGRGSPSAPVRHASGSPRRASGLADVRCARTGDRSVTAHGGREQPGLGQPAGRRGGRPGRRAVVDGRRRRQPAVPRTHALDAGRGRGRAAGRRPLGRGEAARGAGGSAARSRRCSPRAWTAWAPRTGR